MTLVADALVIARFNLRRIARNPGMLLMRVFQPVLFVMLFAYVFSDAISAPGYDYADFFVPGLAVQVIAFNAVSSAVWMAQELRNGMVDRFRSLPMARSALLAGRALSDAVTNVASLAAMLAMGYVVGFSFHAGLLQIAAGLVLVVVFGQALSWVFCYLGLRVSSPEAASSFVSLAVLPVMYTASVYVPTDAMPAEVQPVAEANPITTIVDALRALWVDGPAGTDIGFALFWCVVITATFAALATTRYRDLATS